VLPPDEEKTNAVSSSGTSRNAGERNLHWGWLTLGGSVNEDSSIDIVNAAIEMGINFIDLADMYSYGEAERVVGEVLPNHRRQDLVISSKAYWPMSENVNDRGLSRKHIMESVENSLRRLGTDYLDIFFAHR
jgi:aryl-alcohol dehydrogenase-like predicted oxidoreductase